MKMLSVNSRNLIAEQEPELRGLKVLYGLYAFFFISSIVMPQYFGIHIGYDITCARFANILFIGYMIANPRIMTHFVQTTFRCEIFYPFVLYLMVAGYTMVFRGDLNAFFLVFLEAFSLFMMIYGIRYVIGYKRAIRWVIGCAYFLGFLGLVEFVYGKSLFLQFLKTMDTGVANAYRSGHYRIMGPCGHSLGYGLVLLLFIAISCIDLEKKEIYIFKRPVLMFVLLANVFLTGSRSTLGIAILELVIIFIFSKQNSKKKTLFWVIGAIVALVGFLLIFHNTKIGQYLMGQIASVIDHVFGTNHAVKYGVEVERLEDSEAYRKALPQIFKLDWLNPLVGRGSKGFGAEIDGIFIHSIDNYYISQFIKYAYPGLITYILILITTVFVILRYLYQKRSKNAALAKLVLVGVIMYFFNLWWVDALQTLKYIYIVIAIFYAIYLEEADKKASTE